MTENNWQQALPAISQLADADINAIFNQAQLIHLPAKATVFHQGDACHNYLIVISGSVRVFTRAENGREIVLYRLYNGDSCVLTTSCLFGKSHYPAEGIAETELRALAIPTLVFNQGIQQSDSFRKLVFSSFTTHVHLLITLVEEVAFGKLDIRLARHLIELYHRLGDENNTLAITHQTLATELGTAREVISRQLKELAQKDIIQLQRGSITIIDMAALNQLAGNVT